MQSSDNDPVHYAVISARGEILRHGVAPYNIALDQYDSEGDEALVTSEEFPADFCDTCYFWDYDTNTFERLPAKPEAGIPLFDWDSWEWVDATPPPPNLNEEFNVRRAATRITRGELFRAARRARLIDMDEARQLSRGEIPLSLGHLIAALPAGMRDDFELQFIAAIDIGRLDVLILIIAGEMIPPEPAPGVTRDDLLDMLFGLRTWSEHYPEI